MRSSAARPLAAAIALLFAASLPAQSNTERVANDHYGRSHDYDLVHERIELRNFDWDSTSFDGSVAVTLRALRPAFDSVVLDAGHLLAVGAVKDRAGTLAFAAHGDTLVVRLRKPAAMGDTVRFTIAYHGVVENGRGLTFLEEDGGPPRRPQQIWSQGEAEDNHLWFPTYDHPNDRLTWEISVTVKKNLTVVSNGRLLADAANKDGTHTVRWSQELPASSYLASIVIAPLAKLRDSWKGKPVDYYVYRVGHRQRPPALQANAGPDRRLLAAHRRGLSLAQVRADHGRRVLRRHGERERDDPRGLHPRPHRVSRRSLVPLRSSSRTSWRTSGSATGSPRRAGRTSG